LKPGFYTSELWLIIASLAMTIYEVLPSIMKDGKITFEEIATALLITAPPIFYARYRTYAKVEQGKLGLFNNSPSPCGQTCPSCGCEERPCAHCSCRNS
jgi:hypothetical protein